MSPLAVIPPGPAKLLKGKSLHKLRKFRYFFHSKRHSRQSQGLFPKTWRCSSIRETLLCKYWPVLKETVIKGCQRWQEPLRLGCDIWSQVLGALLHWQTGFSKWRVVVDGLCFFFVFFFNFNWGCFIPGNNEGNTTKGTESCYCPGLNCAMIQTMIQHLDQTNKDLAGRNMKKNESSGWKNIGERRGLHLQWGWWKSPKQAQEWWAGPQ